MELLIGRLVNKCMSKHLNANANVSLEVMVKVHIQTHMVENIVGSGKGGSVLVHVGTNNVEREGTTAIVRKYRNFVRILKQTRVEQVILSGILLVIGRRGHRCRNCRGWQLTC